MRKFFLLLLAALSGSTLSFAVQPGNTEAEVTATLGKPNAVRQSAGGVTIWRYTNGTVVRLEGGVVREIEGPGATVPVKTAGGAPAPESVVVTPPPAAPSPKAAPALPKNTAPTQAPSPSPAANRPAVPPSAQKTAGPTPWLGAGRRLTQDEVVKLLGPPLSQMRNGMAYPGLELFFKEGVLTSVQGPNVDLLIRAARGQDIGKALTHVNSAPPTPPPEPSALEKTKRVIGFILVGIGALGAVICNLSIIVCAFQTSVFWGVICLLFPVLQIVFVAKHYREKPAVKYAALGLYLACVPMFLLGIYLTG